MDISYNWIHDYLKISENGNPIMLKPEHLGEILTETGLELESITLYEPIPGSLNGLIIGKILSVEKHPNADKLTLTKVDTGNENALSIICGAPNVAVGQKVVVAPVNTTIFPLNNEPFTIKKAKIRGVESQGMICAEDEIGLGTSHDGIIVLPDIAKIGQPASEHYNITQDWIFDIALTPNRSDAHSHIGVARDLMAYLKINTKYDIQLNLPEPELDRNAAHALEIDVKVLNPEACPRYSGIIIENLAIDVSPKWLKDRLKSIGVKPINNVVDITNFVLHEMGQPLHALDFDKIKGQSIRVQTLAEGTAFVTLDGETKKLHGEDLIICDAENGMCIAGVYGGSGSGVSNETKTLFLESAYFDPVSIRKSALRHNLRTDAAMHFEKGIDPGMTVQALARAYELMKELAGGKLASPLIDIKQKEFKEHTIQIKLSYIHKLTGEYIDPVAIQNIFESLGINVLDKSGDDWELSVPTYRTEVTRPADLVEELLRIYGFNRISMDENFKPYIADHPSTLEGEVKSKVANYLTSNGFFENSTVSFSHSKQLEKTYKNGSNEIVTLENPISSEMDVMRPDMLNSTLQTLSYNLNRSNTQLKLFEFGRSYHKNGKDYFENYHLAIAMTGTFYTETWETNKRATGFFDMKTTVQNILKLCGLKNISFNTHEGYPLEYGQNIIHNQKSIGYFGKTLQGINTASGIKKEIWYADLNWKAIQKSSSKSSTVFEEIPKFPSIRRDLAMIIDRTVQYSEIESIVRKVGGKLLKDVHLFDIYEDKKIGDHKVSYAISFVFQDLSKTLTDKNIDKIMVKMIQEIESRLNISIRK